MNKTNKFDLRRLNREGLVEISIEEARKCIKTKIKKPNIKVKLNYHESKLEVTFTC